MFISFNSFKISFIDIDLNTDVYTFMTKNITNADQSA
jgi:hypothetical protein